MNDPARNLIPAVAEPLILLVMVLFGMYLAYEVRRWFSGNRANLTAGQFRRRILTGLIIEADLVLWLMANHIWQFVGEMPAARLAALKLLYLLFATLLIFLALIQAVREAAFIVRQYANWRREIIRGVARGDHRSENGSA
jgi:hypothetical protein